MLQRIMVTALFVVITSSLGWADGFRPGSSYRDYGGRGYTVGRPDPDWYGGGCCGYTVGRPIYGYGYGGRGYTIGHPDPDWYGGGCGYVEPNYDYGGRGYTIGRPNPGWGRGGDSTGEAAAFVIGGLLGYYLGDRQESGPFCSRCGQRASSQGANFCSKCGATLHQGQSTTNTIPPCVGGSEICPAP